LIPERWGSPLVQEKYQGEIACDKINNNNNIIIIIIIIINLEKELHCNIEVYIGNNVVKVRVRWGCLAILSNGEFCLRQH
jgi:hypothetical protein